MHKVSLHEVNQLFANGRNLEAYRLLGQYTQQQPNDVEQLYRIAVLSEQLDTKENTKNWYIKLLRAASNNILAYLYAGCFFYHHIEQALGATILSLGQSIDAKLTELYRYQAYDEHTRKRSLAANWAIRDFLTKQHELVCGAFENIDRIKLAIWPQTHNQEFEYQHPQQKPHLFYIPNLTAKPVWLAKKFSWLNQVNEQLPLLIDEFQHAFTKLVDQQQPYLNQSYQSTEFAQLANTSNWSALHLYQEGQANTRVVQHFPQLMTVLKQLPLYGLNANPYEVFFSLLKPKQHIVPHFGLSNHSLTVHLPIIPQPGYLEVAGEKCYWTDNQAIIFDDSFEHQAINLSDQTRVVLIFSIWHPELSDNEKQAIQASFNQRNAWLTNRQQQLDQLIVDKTEQE